MNAAAKATHCPDCGAQLKPGTDWCWLCNYRSPPIADGSPAADHPTHHVRWMPLVAFILLAVAFGPACAVAFFVGCSAVLIIEAEGVVEFGGGNEANAALVTGLFSALIVGALLTVLLVSLFRSFHRSTLSPDSRNAR